MSRQVLVLYHNSACLPITEPVELDNDPTWVLGDCDIQAGAARVWIVPDSEIRIVVFSD
jgi:hypothetical protein